MFPVRSLVLVLAVTFVSVGASAARSPPTCAAALADARALRLATVTEDEALLRAAASNGDDALPRLVLADWHEERERANLAGFLRLSADVYARAGFELNYRPARRGDLNFARIRVGGAPSLEDVELVWDGQRDLGKMYGLAVREWRTSDYAHRVAELGTIAHLTAEGLPIVTVTSLAALRTAGVDLRNRIFALDIQIYDADAETTVDALVAAPIPHLTHLEVRLRRPPARSTRRLRSFEAPLLRRLSLSGTEASVAAWSEIVQWPLPRLASLDVKDSHGLVGTTLARWKLPQLEALDVSQSDWTVPSARALNDWGLSRLRVLHASFLYGAANTERLAGWHLPELRVLQADGLFLASSTAPFERWRLPSLRRLGLQSNRLNERRFAPFAAWPCPHLVTVTLHHNPLGAAGWARFAAWQLPALAYAELGLTRVQQDDTDPATTLRDWKAPELRYFDLRDNLIHTQGYQALRTIEAPKLRLMSLSGNAIDLPSLHALEPWALMSEYGPLE